MVTTAEITKLEKSFNDKLKKLKTEYDGKFNKKDQEINMLKQKVEILSKKEEDTNLLNQKVNTLQNEISCKDKQLIAVNKELLEVKKSVQYMSDKLDESSILSNETHQEVSKTHNLIKWVKEKTEDLEDRSRRDNLVFFNVPEQIDNGGNEDCEKLIHDELVSRGFKEEMPDEDIFFERVHRLGPRKHNAKHPRPIIAKLTYHKQKQQLLQNGRLLKDSVMNMSEDYCRETLLLHKDLREYAKEAKNNYHDSAKSIVWYNVVYKKVLLTYTLDKKNKEAKTFTRGFNIHDIKRNPAHWYKPT